MMTLAVNGRFAPLDWAVLAGYFVILAASGAYFAWRASRRTGDPASSYFLGEQAMPVWAVAVSILATAQSAATFTGAPEQAYVGDLSYLATNLGGLLAAVILALVFIPAYYRHGVGTPYQLLEKRFGPGAKLATSWAYMVGRVFASGSRVYVGAIPVSIAVFGDASAAHLAIAVGAFMGFGILYTLAGGITSVIWTDVLQVGVYLGAAVLAVILLASKITAPWADVLGALSHGTPDGTSKLTLLRSGVEHGTFKWANQFNLATIVTGFVLLTLASHGTDQDLVQRMLTCRSARKGSWSVISGILIGIPAVAVFMALGLLLWIFYTRPELMGAAVAHAPPGQGSEVLLTYIMHEMPAGAAGLMIAGVMAAGPAGINSGLNSMASTLISDVYRPARPDRSDAHYRRAGRWTVVAWGVVLGVFALACIPWRQHSGQTIIDFVLSVMSFAYAGLLGVFFTALFTKRGTTASAIAALFVGFLVVLALRPEIVAKWSTLLHIKPPFTLAFPWQLVFGTAAATAVCAAAPGKAGSGPAPRRS